MDQGSQNVFVEKYLTPLAVLLAAVIIAFAFIFGSGISGKNSDGETPQEQAVDVKNIKTEGVPFIGDVNAPTTVAIYSDFECGFCKQFEQNVVPKLIESYVSTGKTKILFKDFQFLSEDSTTIAVYARAVFATHPEQFYDWYKAVYEAQDTAPGGFGNLASVSALTKTIDGIDVVKVEKLMNDKKAEFTAAVAADRAEGASFGINGTPTIIVGKEKLSELSPDAFFAKIGASIEADLK